MRIDKQKNLELIQVLRGIASLMVVFYHASINMYDSSGTHFFGSVFLNGYSGVDVFFVLSGFIITYTCLPYVNDPGNVVPFLKRRAIRIYPVYWIIITGFILARVVLPSLYQTDPGYSISTMIGTYLLTPGHLMINGVSWTLTFELLFYLFFALVFIIGNKRLISILVALYLSAILVINFTDIHTRIDNELLRHLISPLVIEFFMGVLAALMLRKFPTRYSRPAVLAGIALFVVGSILEYQKNGLFENPVTGRVFFYGTASFLIILGLANIDLHRASGKVHSLLLSLGDASYSLYLLHLPIIAASAKVIQKFNFNIYLNHAAMFGVIVITCVASILFYKLVEKPMIRFLNRKLNAGWKSSRGVTR